MGTSYKIKYVILYFIQVNIMLNKYTFEKNVYHHRIHLNIIVKDMSILKYCKL